MHSNLVRIQENMLENFKENMKILETTDKKPIIIAALALAERPLTEEEIAARTRMSANEVRKSLGSLVKIAVIIKDTNDGSGKDVYELNADMEKILAGHVQSKLEALRNNTKKHISKCEELLETSKAEFDDYDRLMAKYLRERISKMKLVTTIMTKRSSFLRLLDSGSDESGRINKISIS
jgi:DNA-binding transcriptional regulator GbsR (MarR family)